MMYILWSKHIISIHFSVGHNLLKKIPLLEVKSIINNNHNLLYYKIQYSEIKFYKSR